MSRLHYRKLIILGLCSVALLQASCEPSVRGSGTTQPAKEVEWDFTDGAELSRIKVPWDSPQEVQYIYGRKRLTLKLRKGLSGVVEVDGIQVWREQDSPNVRIITLFTEPGTVEEVYAAAIKLADDWKIKQRNNLERFSKTSGRTLLRDESAINQTEDDPVQPRWIEIRPSFVPGDKKWIAMLNVGFPALKAESATKPAH